MVSENGWYHWENESARESSLLSSNLSAISDRTESRADVSISNKQSGDTSISDISVEHSSDLSSGSYPSARFDSDVAASDNSGEETIPQHGCY